MPDKTFKKVWKLPLLMAGLIVFGLLSALLGTGVWYPIAWLNIFIPLAVIVWYWLKARIGKKAGYPDA
jgi:hypothetical protein